MGMKYIENMFPELLQLCLIIMDMKLLLCVFFMNKIYKNVY